MSSGLRLETCEILLSYAIVYRRPPSCFYYCGCCAHVLPCTLPVDMRRSWLLCVVICPKFDPNNTSVKVKIFKMATTFDQELRKAFQELQGKMIETTQRVKIAEGQIMQLRRNIAHAKLTDQELASLPSDTPTYESVGRMFVLQPISDIRKELAEKLHSNEEKIKSIEANKEYLQRSVKEHEDNIREMLASRPK